MLMTKVARAYHAGAVCFDALRLLRELNNEENAAQRRAHSRSRELAQQIQAAGGSAEPCIPLAWEPMPPLPSLPQGNPPSSTEDAVMPPSGTANENKQPSDAEIGIISPSKTNEEITVQLTEAEENIPPSGASEMISSTSGAQEETTETSGAAEVIDPSSDSAFHDGGQSQAISEGGSSTSQSLPANKGMEGSLGGECIVLPPGWERRYDRDSRRFFYVDFVNKTTSWQLPDADSALSTPVSHASPLEPSTASDEPPMTSTSRAEFPEPSIPVTKPPAAAKSASAEAPPAARSAEASTSEKQTSISPSKDSRPLPAGWECRIDVSTGRYFYVDMVGKTTSWTHPLDSEAAEPVAAEVTVDSAALYPTIEDYPAASSDSSEVAGQGSRMEQQKQRHELPPPSSELPELPDLGLSSEQKKQVDELTQSTLDTAEAMFDRMKIIDPLHPSRKNDAEAKSKRDAMKKERAAYREAAVKNILNIRLRAEELKKELERNR